MVNGVSGESKLGVLLQQKQKKLESINQQKQAVQDALNMENDKAKNAEVDLGNKKMSLSDAIVALQNHPFKGMKEPDSSDVKYEIKDAEGKSNGYNQAQFDKDMKEFQKAEAEYKDLEKNVEKTTKEVVLGETALQELVEIAQKKEEELKAKDTEYEVTMGDIDNLNKQIEEESKTAQVDVTLSKDKNNDTLVEATVNQLKALQEQGLVDKNIDLKNLKPEQLKKLSEAVVNQDIKNGTVAEGTSLDGTSADYTKLKEGDGRKYTVAQMQELAKSLNTETDSGTSYDITEDNINIDNLPTSFVDKPKTDEPSKDELAGLNTKPDAKTNNTEIVFPRGVEWQNTKGDKLSDFGIVDNGDGTYTSSTGKTHTAEEVNKWFRQIENTVDSNYSKYLDKAKELGIDYIQYSSAKDLKNAVKTEEKRQKAIDKYSDEIKQYNIQTEGRTADQIKADVKAAKEKAKTSGVTSATTSLSASSSTSAESKTNTNSSETKTNTSSETKDTTSSETKNSIRKSLLNSLNNVHSSFDNVDDFLTNNDYLTNNDNINNMQADNYKKITSNFKDGARGMYDINGTRFAAIQKISKSGQQAYLVNGEYYGLRSDGMPNLSKKLNKADFEK